MMGDVFNELEKQYDVYPINNHISITRRVYDFLLYNFNFLAFNKPAKVIFDICNKYNLKKKKILDVGSFTGYNSFYFKCKKNTVTGIELSNKIDYAIRRYNAYKINFIKGNVLDFISKENLSSFDFVFCCNLPIHYDSGSILHSEMANIFLKTVYKNLNFDTVFYYLFYSTKHSKVGYPVKTDEMELLLKELAIEEWSLSEKIIYDFPMVELIIKKTHAKQRDI